MHHKTEIEHHDEQINIIRSWGDDKGRKNLMSTSGFLHLVHTRCLALFKNLMCPTNTLGNFVDLQKLEFGCGQQAMSTCNPLSKTLIWLVIYTIWRKNDHLLIGDVGWSFLWYHTYDSCLGHINSGKVWSKRSCWNQWELNLHPNLHTKICMSTDKNKYF